MNLENQRVGRLLIVSGPTMVGKGSACRGLLEKVGEERRRYPDGRRELRFSVSFTTRLPRPGEVDGVDYSFVSNERFEEMIACGDFLEYENVHGKYYGTSLRVIEEWLLQGIDVLLDIDVKGRQKIIASGVAERLRTSIVSVMIIPPKFRLIRKRLSGSDRNDAGRRLAAARAEMKQRGSYDVTIINFVGLLRTTVGVLHAVFYEESGH